MEPIRTGLRRVMHDLLANQPAQEAVVLAWPLVCGKDVASRTRVVGLAEGRLTIEVPDAGWRTQLATFSSRYVKSYAELMGPVVKEVRFKAISK
jgi:predicted nucleic acid-binding Zn ribbon protein